MTSIARSCYVARFPSPPFETTLGQLLNAAETFMAAPSVIIARQRKRRRRTIDVRPMVCEFAVVAEDEVVLRLTTANDQSVKPTEVLQAALGLDWAVVPLIQIHKLEATFASGDRPTTGALARAEVTDFEERDSHYGTQPARDARGYSGGQSPS